MVDDVCGAHCDARRADAALRTAPGDERALHRTQSISKTMAAACIVFDGNIVRETRIGLGAVADRPIRATAVEAAVRGLPRAQAAEAVSAALATMIAPITDVRSTSAYRLDVAQRIVARFFAA